MQLDSIVGNARARLARFSFEEPVEAALPALSPWEVAALIDHTALKADTTVERIRTLCAEAREYGFASVCVNPVWVDLCQELLAGSGTRVCTVVGFPLGATTTSVKAFEARDAIAAGASEVDMVLNVGALRGDDYAFVLADIAAVVSAGHADGAAVKVIFENCLLTDDEKAIAARLCVEAGADFVKTSTGFSSGGATLRDVALMRHMVGTDAGVKAAGGVQSYATLVRMVAAGATRIGASAGKAIVAELVHA